jgi:RNA polymerase sigma factor for flagellar operon FliA
MRVKGAMLDELRQMDFLSRGERRKIKIIQIARERHRSCHGKEPSLAQLTELTELDMDEVQALLQADQMGRNQSSLDDEPDDASHRHHPATPRKRWRRVDTGIVLPAGAVLRRTARAGTPGDRVLPGVGLTPVEVAKSLKVTPSRVSQIYHSVVRKAAAHFAEPPRQRALDRYPDKQSEAFQELIAQRERELAARRPAAGASSWRRCSRAPVDPVTDA